MYSVQTGTYLYIPKTLISYNRSRFQMSDSEPESCVCWEFVLTPPMRESESVSRQGGAAHDGRVHAIVASQLCRMSAQPYRITAALQRRSVVQLGSWDQAGRGLPAQLPQHARRTVTLSALSRTGSWASSRAASSHDPSQPGEGGLPCLSCTRRRSGEGQRRKDRPARKVAAAR